MAWDRSDEEKLKASFGLGKRDLFSQLYDVNLMAKSLGINIAGLKNLATFLWDYTPQKPRKVNPLYVSDGLDL